MHAAFMNKARIFVKRKCDSSVALAPKGAGCLGVLSGGELGRKGHQAL